MPVSKKELKAILDEEKYWKELEKYLPWLVHGWTYKDRASYLTDRRTILQISGKQRNDIVNAIRESTDH